MTAASHLVFDVSGVLRDTRRLIKRAYDTAFRAHGVNIDVDPGMVYKLRGLDDFNDLRNSFRLLLGTNGELHERVMNTRGANKLLVEEMRARAVDEALVDALRIAYREEFSASANDELVTLLPGVAEGLAVLAKRFTLGVLSNSSLESIHRDLGPELVAHFDFVIADAGKPDPGVLLDALASRRIPPHNAIYVGDAVSDVTLAQAAGTRSVALLTGMGTAKHLKAKGPDMVCETFEDMVAKLTAA